MNTSDITCVKITENMTTNTDVLITLTSLTSFSNNSNNESEWYDRVYLCYEDINFKPSNTYQRIKGFDCYRYNSFKNADYAWNNYKTELHKLEVRHTMIPMCRWVPEIFDRYILNLKLRKMYWGGKICMGRGYNKYK